MCKNEGEFFLLLHRLLSRKLFLNHLKTKYYGIQYQKQKFFEIAGFYAQRNKIHA